MVNTTDADKPKLRATAASPSATGRLETLDGMRGVAAFLVVIYHFFGRWAYPEHSETLYPYGNALEILPPIAVFGHIGVYLFFLISGFVIMMTLERSKGILDFAGRRAARLWPSMLVCATLSALIINLSDLDKYFGMPEWHVRPVEYFSSIFFIEPGLVSQIFDLGDVQWVEGVYWTLWCEVRFYALIAIVFLLAPRAWFFWTWAAVQGLSTTIEVSEAAFPQVWDALSPLIMPLQPSFLGWFSMGIAGYLYWTNRFSGAAIAILVLGLTAVFANQVVDLSNGIALAESGTRRFLTYLAIFLPFILFLRQSPVLNVLTYRPVIAVGLASYPLYLFHERVGMAAVMELTKLGVPPLLTAFIAIAGAVAAALLIHKLVEMPGKRWITDRVKPWAANLEQRYVWLRFRPA